MSEWIQGVTAIGQMLITGGLLWVTYNAVERMRQVSIERNKQLDRMEEATRTQTAALQKLLETK